MKKRTLALLLAAVMLLSVLAGCNNDKPVETKPNKPAETKPGATQPAETPAEPELIEIVTSKSYYQDPFDSDGKNSPVYAEIVKKTNVELKYTSVDNDQLQVRIASKDMGDLFIINDATQLYDLIESDMLMPLNDAIAEYAPWIISDWPELWAYACDITENSEGTAYALPVNAGDDGDLGYAIRNIYTVRWDLYEAMGCPVITNEDEYIQLLAGMMALQPTNAEGKKVYGASFYLEDTSFYQFIQHMAHTNGWNNKKGHFVHEDIRTNEVVYSMYDVNGPFWRAADYYNRCYRAGVLDPDCFTQQEEDFEARIDNGELLNCSNLMDADYETAQLAIDPNSKAGFISLPVDGTLFYDRAACPIGWEATCALAIPKNSSNPEAALRLIAYLFSEEGARTVKSGVQGIHWDYVDGVPTYNDETLALIAAGGDEYKKTGINLTCFECMSGITNSHILSDGHPADLTRGDAYRSTKDYTPAFKAFSEHYGVSYPAQIFKQKVEEGKMLDLRNASTASLDVTDEDIDRIDTICVKICLEAIPKLVTAADDAAFEAIKAETLDALKAAGAEQAEAFYKNAWAEANAK